MGLQAKPIDAALALDILQKLSEEGVRVTLTYQKRDAHAPAVGGMYHLKLEGKFWDEGAGEFAETWGVRLEEACETALDLFRRAWTENHGWTEQSSKADQPPPPEGPPLEFVSESGKIREPKP